MFFLTTRKQKIKFGAAFLGRTRALSGTAEKNVQRFYSQV
jgi:hypothetical protein